MASQDWSEFRDELRQTLRDAVALQLRWSHVLLLLLVAGGVLVNVLLPHGWTAWPVVLAVWLIAVVNEAADRNGVGIPPLAVYGFFAGAVAVWLGGVFLLSALNPVVLLLALASLGYLCARGYLQTRARRELMDQRRMAGQCVHCGEPAQEGQIDCENCGQIVNPDAVRARTTTVRSQRDVARLRAVLKPASNTALAAAKEQALLAKRHRPRVAKKS